MSKILAIILAGGAGSRVGELYNEDEPVKAMLKLGKERLIEKSLSAFEDIDVDLSVLSFPDPKFDTLNKLVEDRGVKLFVQKAKQRKLPVMLELPYILFWQYHVSSDRKLLKTYDHIITLPCDLILNSDDIKRMIDMQLSCKMKRPKQMGVMLSRACKEGEYGTKFLMDGTRIMGMKSARKETTDEWVKTTQAGVYLLSKELMMNPIPFFFNIKYANARMCFTDNDWVDYGIRENILAAREAIE